MATTLVLFAMFSMAIVPSLFSIRAVRRHEARMQATIARARRTLRSPQPPYPNGRSLPPELVYIPGAGYVIGNLSCRFNARSPQLRCAVNPTGPCADCRFYESTL